MDAIIYAYETEAGLDAEVPAAVEAEFDEVREAA